MSRDLDLSVVVPLYNEVDNVEPLHGELTRALAGTVPAYELILVDDGSSDGTAEKLRAVAAPDPRVKVLRFRRNYGQTPALQAGFDHARGRVVVTMDGDLQNDPADIPRLLAQIDAGYDVVSGWRRERKDRFLTRRLPSMAANWLIGRITGVRIRDNGCTLKAFRREVVKKARLYAEMHRFLAPMLSLSGCRLKEIAVHHRARRFGSSKYGLSRIWKVFLDLLVVKMLLRFIAHPAAWFGLLAVPFVVAAAVALGVSLWLYFAGAETGEPSIVFPSVTVLFVFASVHLLLLGSFAELVVRVGEYRETQPLVTDREAIEGAQPGVEQNV